jgi:formate dehydrogenase major subunit
MAVLTIDGKKIEVPEGTTVLLAARQVGIDIPTLCDNPHLPPYGACRMCVVEVEGNRLLQTSCTLPALDNMVIHTNTEKVRSARKFLLGLIFSDRNHFCPYCVVNDGDCELQQAAYHEEMTHWPLQPHWIPYEVDASHEFFVHDHNRCILCRRCVRACSELVGNFALGVEERGSASMIIADLGVPQGESTCISCGTCTQVCPTGSLIDRWSAYRGQEKDLKQTSSICLGCSIGCGITTFTANNQLVRIDGDWDVPVSGGLLCKTGRYLPLDERRERVRTPLVRLDGKLHPEYWESALETAAEHISPTLAEDGRFTGIVSTRLPAEAICLFKQMFTDESSQVSITTTEGGLSTQFSYRIAEKLGRPFEDRLQSIDKSDCIVVINSNIVDDHQVSSFFVKRNVAKGIPLILITSRENPLEPVANITFHVNGKFNVTDVLDGLIAGLVEEGLNRVVSSIESEQVLEHATVLAGTDADQFLMAARLLGQSKRPTFIFTDGLSFRNEPRAMEKFIELAQLSGTMREDHSGVISLKGGANSAIAAQYNLDQPVSLDGHQVVYVALGDEDPSQELLNLVKEAPYLIVQAAFQSELTAMADVVLPSATWLEEGGHYLNMEGRLQKANPSLELPENVLSNELILRRLAARLDISSRCTGDWHEHLKVRTPSAAIEELLNLRQRD